MPEALVIANRAAMFAAAALTFGTPALLMLHARGNLAVVLAERLAGLMRAASIVFFAATVAALPLASAVIAESLSGAADPLVIAQLATGTQMGRVSLMRILLAGSVLVAAHAYLRPARRPQPRNIALLSGLAIASFAFTGHTAMHEGGLRAAHQINHIIHVISGLFWFGALVPLLAAAVSIAGDRPALQSIHLLRAFSTAGLATVTLVALTGILNTWLILGHPPLDRESWYQVLLAAKIATVLAMLGLAAVNRLWLVPRAALTLDVTLLRATILAELLLGALVLALVAIFGTLEPV